MSPLASICRPVYRLGRTFLQQITCSRRLGAELGHLSADRPPVCTHHGVLIPCALHGLAWRSAPTGSKLLPARFQRTAAHQNGAGCEASRSAIAMVPHCFSDSQCSLAWRAIASTSSSRDFCTIAKSRVLQGPRLVSGTSRSG